MDIKEHLYNDDPSQGPADVCNNPPACLYYFVGNGRIQAAIQANRSGSGTPLGLLLMHPERLGKKREALNFDPDRGLEDSRVRVGVDGHEVPPPRIGFEVEWERRGHVPVVGAHWRGRSIAVHEEFFCPEMTEPRLRRVVTVTNISDTEYRVELSTGVPVRGPGGDSTIQRVRDEHRSVAPGEQAVSVFEYVLGEQPNGDVVVELTLAADGPPAKEVEQYWSGVTRIDVGDDDLNHLFEVSAVQLPAAISASGFMDGSVWQYNLEWVRDQSMVVVGLLMSGHQDLAQTMTGRLLERFISEEGAPIDSGRVREPAEVELDQNGELLYALWSLWAWRGEAAVDFLRRHWQKIVAVAEFPLRGTFYDQKSGLLRNVREYWERHSHHGIREGYELAYQFFVVLGLEKAAVMAGRLGHPDLAQRWGTAATKLKRAILGHPRFALVEDGHLIKRRLVSGEVQHPLEVPDPSILPDGVPLSTDPVHDLEPDTSEALPIAFEWIDPRGELARGTLAHLETLWNQRWRTGGYGRYHVSSEPDSPGAWPFASLFVARAYLEAGDGDKALRVLRWLRAVEGGDSGSWFEFYGPRPIPPCPQVGIVPWTWAEMIIFFVHHLLGVRPDADGLVIRPRLLPGMQGAEAQLTVYGHRLQLTVRRAADVADRRARVDGQEIPLREAVLHWPVPETDLTIELEI